MNNMRGVQSGMELMSRCVNGNTLKISSVNTADEASKLNKFFDCHDFLFVCENIGRSMMFRLRRLLTMKTFKGSVQVRMRFDV